MILRPDQPPGDADWLDDEFPLGDGTADTVARGHCPYCGEPVELVLDPGSGTTQSYVEDCPVCCSPWEVRVHYDAGGAAHVSLERAGDD